MGNAPIDWTPYPWKTLERIPRAGVRAIRRAHARLPDPSLPQRIDDAAAQILGLPHVRITNRRLRMASPAHPVFSNGVVCLVADQGRTAQVLVEVEPELAHRIASTLLARPPLWVDRSQPTPPTLHAAFGAFLIAAIRRASPDHGLHLVAVGPPARQGFVVQAPESAATFDLAVVLADAAFGAAVTYYDALPASPSPARFGLEALRNLGHVPLRLQIVAAVVSCSRQELSSLERGDALLPMRGWSTHLESDKLCGKVFLAAPSSDLGLAGELRSDGGIVIREVSMRSQDSDVGGRKSSESGELPIAEALADVPVVIRVEVGSVSLSAREWAAVQPGDVLTTGSKVAEYVRLRVGGVEVARGQLVDVEGELGVRIHELAAPKGGGG